MLDGGRAVQFARSKAKEWNIDKARIAATGGSAGAGISLWLAFRDDLADPKSDDPVARESTRLTCAAVRHRDDYKGKSDTLNKEMVEFFVRHLKK
jgi:acetyl esterase/lipase